MSQQIIFSILISFSLILIFINIFFLIFFNLRKNKIFDILFNIKIPILIVSKSGRILYNNESALKFFGYSGREFKETGINKIFDKKDYAHLKEKIESGLDSEELMKLKCRKKNKETVSSIFKLKKINGYILLEITEPSQLLDSEKKIRESQRLLSTLIGNLPGIIYLSDSKDIFMMKFISDGCYELTGHDPIDIIDNNKLQFSDLIHPEDRDFYKNQIKASLKNKKPYHISFRIILPDKTDKWLWERGNPIFTGDKKFLAIGGFISDITEYKIMEKKIGEEKEKLSVTLRSIGDGVITTDTNGRVIIVNKVAEKLTGWSQKEAQGKLLNEIFNIINEKTRIPCKNPIEKVLEKGKIVGLANHTVLISKDGIERVIADSGAPIKDNKSKIIGVVLVFRDVTEKSKIEQEMNKILKLESLSVLAGGIAHDFNNILTAILGNINLAKLYSQDNKTLYELLIEAEKATYNSKKLTDQLLTFAKGGAPIKKTGDIQKIIDENLSFSLRGTNIKYDIDADNDLSLIDFDEGQMSQVFNNLVINSRQAMPNGGRIKVTIKNITKENDDLSLIRKGEYIRIYFEDNGVGISKENISKVFDPFFTTKKDGKGLGLASVYSIIKKHDGLIRVESKKGKGTNIIIYLPATKGKRIKYSEQHNEEGIVKGKGKILILDDEYEIQNILKKLLEYLGYESDFASNGEEAIKKYKKNFKKNKKFDCVLLDLTIPGSIGGKEVLKELLKINPKINAIVISGYSNDPVISNYELYGFKGAVIKPFKLEEISEELDKVLNK